MKYVGCVLLILAGSALALGQGGTGHPYQPAVPQGNTVVAGGGYGGNYGGSTAAGSAMNGMASVISAKGDYNLSTSAAAINMTQAQKNEIQNRQQWTNTYFDMRATNRAARAGRGGPKADDGTACPHRSRGLPAPITPSQIDPMTGKIDWPSAAASRLLRRRACRVGQAYGQAGRLGRPRLLRPGESPRRHRRHVANLKSLIREVPRRKYTSPRGTSSAA